MRVLVVADGTRGDVQPMTVIAQQLLREGQLGDVRGPADVSCFVEATGSSSAAAFDSEAMVKANPRSPPAADRPMLRAVPALFVQRHRIQLEALPALAKHADFIWWAGSYRCAQCRRIRGVPWRWVLYTSICIRRMSTRR